MSAPQQETIDTYIQSGAENARPHVLTDREWKLVERALANLPPLHQRILRAHLARLSFIEAPSSAGTALTRAFDGPNGEKLFEITVRADVLETSLTDFLNKKEAVVFSEDGSGYSVHIDAGNMPALTYLLLHETSHVVDRSLGIVDDKGPFADIWSDYLGLCLPYAKSELAHSTYRRDMKRPAGDSPSLYAALAQSPFVSLYATASAGEDVAELMAWNQLGGRFHVPLRIEVKDITGRPVFTVEPLKSPAVQSRMRRLNEIAERKSASLSTAHNR